MALSLALVFSACAKKDSEYASKYKSRSGAQVADGEASDQAAEDAAVQNVLLDIVQVERQASGSTMVITSLILLNNQQVPVTTRHTVTSDATAQQKITGTTQIAGVNVVYNAVCTNARCEPVYISAEAYKGAANSQPTLEIGMRKYFEAANTKFDVYQYFAPQYSNANRVVPLISGSSWTSADMSNGSVVVGYLNGAKGYGGGNSGYVK
jgi:hypothetical protein